MKPRLLDLFCGAGGAAMGYHRAGFEVVGVDIKPQKNYPFEFHQGDAMTWPLEGFDAIHASPPCQAYSRAMKHRQAGKEHPELIDATRCRLKATRKPWIIENVVGAPIPLGPTIWGEFGVMLCGSSLGLRRVRRHRLFETSFAVDTLPCRHKGEPPLNPYRTASRIRDGLQKGSMKAFSAAMGIDWMADKEATLAIPPAYTEYIGKQLMAVLR